VASHQLAVEHPGALGSLSFAVLYVPCAFAAAALPAGAVEIDPKAALGQDRANAARTRSCSSFAAHPANESKMAHAILTSMAATVGTGGSTVNAAGSESANLHALASQPRPSRTYENHDGRKR